MAATTQQISDQYLQSPPVLRSQTTYAGMNEWRNMQGRSFLPSRIPVTMTDSNWREIKSDDGLRYTPGTTPRPLPPKSRTDEFYRRYNQLADNVAYRYPNPGPPRIRQGRIGGSWRHITEVQGHTGSRVIFVDGVVSLYDKSLNRRPHTHHAAVRSTPIYEDNSAPAPLPPVRAPASARSDSVASKYKGFYQLR